jgi:hypothetical protein
MQRNKRGMLLREEGRSPSIVNKWLQQPPSTKVFLKQEGKTRPENLSGHEYLGKILKKRRGGLEITPKTPCCAFPAVMTKYLLSE